MIALKLFGSPSLTHAHTPITGPAAQRLRIALLALLAVHGERGIVREKLIAYLWPEADGERGRHLLSNSLYVLRRALGTDCILATGDALRLNPACVQSDIEEFLSAIEKGDRDRAVAMYSAPLLDGFFLADAPEFERWLEKERERFARMYADSLERIAQERDSEGDFCGASLWWRRLCAHDRYNSRFALRLMQALERSGDPGGALQHEQLHTALLREELGVEPDAEVKAFADRLRSAPAREPRSDEQVRPAVANAPRAPVSREAVTVGAIPGRRPTGRGGLPESPRPPESSLRTRRRFVPRRVVLASAALLLLLAGGVHAGWRAGGREAEGTRIRSLAVLPLENCTPDPRRSDRPDAEQEYFADGLTDALITELAQVPGLRVISRTSIMRYKGKCGGRGRRDKSLPEIARELGVDAVVEGTLVRDGQRLRINAQLIRATTDEHLWAHGVEYERGVEDVLTLQREIVAAIAGSIRSRAGTAPLPRGAAVRRANPAAYTLYLKGRYLWNEHQIARYGEALDHFQRAVAIDPLFAPAYAGMADVYVHLDEWGGRPEQGAREKGFQAARRALQLDGSLSEAHASLAHLQMHVEDWTAAGREFQQAVELNPNNGNARILYAFYLSALEQHEDAIEQAVRALEVDPLSERAHAFAGYTLYFARRYHEASAQWQRLLELDPQSEGAHFLIALAHLYGGRQAEGLEWARRGAALAKGAPGSRVALAHCLAIAGQQTEARQLLTDVLRDGRTGHLDPLALAKAHALLGDTDAAFRWLETALGGDHGWLMFLRVEPSYEPLRNDPRFTAILRRLRLDA